MPVVLLERVPVPSLRTYTSISVVLLSCAVYYAVQVLTGAIPLEDSDNNDTTILTNLTKGKSNVTLEQDGYILGSLYVMAHTTWCVWVLVNMAYCCLILFGKLIQYIAFGELRVSEQQHIKDKFWNFVFYKFIFIFGVMNVQDMGEVILWCAWFSVLGFLHLLAQLCKDRFEYLSFSPTTPPFRHVKVLSLLVVILSMAGVLFAACIVICYMYASLNTFAFMAAECVLLINRTLYVLVRYGIHLWDLNHDGVWENRALYVYYSELVFELAGLSVDFLHHLHMLVWGNIFLSMASLVICMQLRYLFHEFQRRIRRHKNYLRVVNSMEAKFPMATKQELENYNDDCAICWEKMESGRKLPCGHFYHNACLRSWLEQDTSCPTCRTNLGDPTPPQQQQPVPTIGTGAPVNMATDQIPNRQLNRTFNHFFHFDGSRYVSWLPSFSVEVTHTELLGGARGAPGPASVRTSQLDNMARQVQDIFPSMPMATVLEDLRITRSVEGTIENIIEGRLVAPPTNMLRSTTDSEHSSSSSLSANDTPHPTVFTHSGASDPDFTDQHSRSEDFEQPSTSTADGSNPISFFMEENICPPPIAENSEEMPSAVGSRFSKSSHEREAMLSSRKDSLLEVARKRFLDKTTTGSVDTSSSEDDIDSVQQRRENACRAAQLRMQQHQ